MPKTTSLLAILLYIFYASPSFANMFKSGCAPSVHSGEKAKLIGIGYGGNETLYSKHITENELLGTLKMSGIWVSRLSPEEYAVTADKFCKFARQNKQSIFIQLPVSFSNETATSILEAMKQDGCIPEGFSIDNEVDRFAEEKIRYGYTVNDYIADYNRLTPIITNVFPSAKIIALELSSFESPHSNDTDPFKVKYQPIVDWLEPFSNAKLVRQPDYLSVHYYPFTGAQREWQTLEGGEKLSKRMKDLEPLLQNAPPILVGEYNTTYQYEGETSYPGSGGDSFMAVLTFPELMSLKQIAGIFHWSLLERPPSTMGMFEFESLRPAPIYTAYKMYTDILDYAPATTETAQADVRAFAYFKDNRYAIILVNRSPFFKRNISISGREKGDVKIAGFKGCKGTENSISLPPFSLTKLSGWLNGENPASVERISYADRTVKNGPFSSDESLMAYCSTLAEFQDFNYNGTHFKTAEYDQNGKIASGGTVFTSASPNEKIVIQRGGGKLSIDCVPTDVKSDYTRCGVELPFVADTAPNRKAGLNWEEGFKNGTVRLSLESNDPLNLLLFVETSTPEELSYNVHRQVAPIAGKKDIEIRLADFRQERGWGKRVDLEDILRRITDMHVEVRDKDYQGRFIIHKVEICDKL